MSRDHDACVHEVLQARFRTLFHNVRFAARLRLRAQPRASPSPVRHPVRGHLDLYRHRLCRRHQMESWREYTLLVWLLSDPRGESKCHCSLAPRPWSFAP